MPIGVLNNIPSLSAENELTLTASALNSTLEQLSSGSRINSGADDPAGLSIANGLQANIAALTQSVSNANNGVGELQLADGALAQVTNLLNTAVTLATESATGTVSNSQRTAIQSQYASILAEINQIGTATTYNGQSVFQSGSAPNLNAADSLNNGTTAPIALTTQLTPGSVTLVQAGGVTFTFTAGTSPGANLNEVTGGGTGLTANSVLNSGAVVTATRATGTTTYTALAATTVGALETAINTGVTTSAFTVAGTDASHAGYTAQLVSGSLAITDLNNNNDLSVVETNASVAGQVATTGQNFTASTNLTDNAVLTITRTGTGNSVTYTTGSAGATIAQLEAAINTGLNQGTTPGTSGITVAFGSAGASAGTQLTAALSGGNLVVTDASNAAAFTAVETLGVNPNVVTGNTGGLTGATVVGAGDVVSISRGGNTTTYTAGSAGSTVTALLAAINTGTSSAGIAGITVGGAAATGLTASLTGGNIQVVDTTNSGNLAVTESGTPNPNSQVTTATGAGITAGTVTASGDVLVLTRGGKTTTYTAGAADTVGGLLAAINAGVTTGNWTVAGSDTGNHGGYTASFVTTGVGLAGTSELEVVNNEGAPVTLTQTTGTSVITGTTAAVLYHAPATDGTYAVGSGAGAQQLILPANTNPTLGTFTTNATSASTVQSLVNAINSNTTVGAKASVVGGQLVVTDPQDRNDLTVTTTDTILGALISGAPSTFLQPTNTGTATPNPNAIIGNAGSLTADTTLTGVASFTAGGKTFTFTATGQAGGDTVGDLINALNSPTDPAGLSAYLSNGNLEVIDPNNNGNIAVGSANTTTVLGTFANPSTTASSTTNIFLSDSTAIGSTQIAVNIGGLATSGITNGSGTGAVNLASSDLSSAADAQAALVLINSAVSNVASVRGTLGASVNRLTAASNVINSQVQNLTSAENTITAADIPTVVANLTKYSILEQTGISALAQANQQQQLVLKLLQ